jgi:hypothetical protein
MSEPQLTLFEHVFRHALGMTMPRPPRARGSDTSSDAADSIEPIAPLLRERVLNIIKTAGPMGLTCDECEAVLGMRHQTVSARVTELRNETRIVDSGQRRPTRSGRKATVWVAV